MIDRNASGCCHAPLINRPGMTTRVRFSAPRLHQAVMPQPAPKTVAKAMPAATLYRDTRITLDPSRPSRARRPDPYRRKMRILARAPRGAIPTSHRVSGSSDGTGPRLTGAGWRDWFRFASSRLRIPRAPASAGPAAQLLLILRCSARRSQRNARRRTLQWSATGGARQSHPGLSSAALAAIRNYSRPAVRRSMKLNETSGFPHGWTVAKTDELRLQRREPPCRSTVLGRIA